MTTVALPADPGTTPCEDRAEATVRAFFAASGRATGTSCSAGSPGGHLGPTPLTCANHQWEFDALTGQGTNPGNCRLTMFGTRVRAGQIEILAQGPE